jgi:hypothetical protein
MFMFFFFERGGEESDLKLDSQFHLCVKLESK